MNNAYWARSARFKALPGLDGVEGQVQFQDVHPRFAQEAPLPGLRVRLHQGPDLDLLQPPGQGHPVRLVERGGGAEVRIEAAAGSGFYARAS